ncbi:hypothetical protein AT251_18560 [Enterovibrio nigricans]|nr:hypothetical protein AT251_18560 [Enterovibrio nigricans]
MLAAPDERNANPQQVLGTLSSTASHLINRAKYDGVIATGGETSRAILDRLGVTSMTLCHQLEKGFPVCCTVLPGSELPFYRHKSRGIWPPRFPEKCHSTIRIQPERRTPWYRMRSRLLSPWVIPPASGQKSF